MQNFYEVYVVHKDGSKDCLGQMAEKHVTHNRYNEGLLIGAGKLQNSDRQKEAFLFHSAAYRNKAMMEFKGAKSTFRGEFCFINFIPETNTVVFGSISAVLEFCTRTGRQIIAEEEQKAEQDASENVSAVA